MPAGTQSFGLDDIELADVDREQAHGRPFLTFASGLERIFQWEMTGENAQSAATNGLTGFILFNSFLLSDFLVLPDSFKLSFILHFCLFTPLWSAVFAMMLSLDRKYYSALAVFASFVPFFIELIILTNSTGLNCLYYMSGLTAAPMCLYIVLRPGLKWAIFCLSTQCVGYLFVLAFTDVVGGGGRLVTALFFISGIVCTIMTAYALEGASRRSFLLSLRVRLLNQKLGRMAMTDPLMGLGNRRLLNEQTTLFWSGSSDSTRLASMILVDVDHFKAFNDHYGHSAGDLCLKTIADCVSGCVHGRNIAVRFGGEEIAVFLPDTELAPARQVAERIREAIIGAAIPHPALAKDAVVSASLGVATVSVASQTADELATRADLALYAAKHRGRNQVWPPAASAEAIAVSPSAALVPCPDAFSLPIPWAS